MTPGTSTRRTTVKSRTPLDGVQRCHRARLRIGACVTPRIAPRDSVVPVPRDSVPAPVDTAVKRPGPRIRIGARLGPAATSHRSLHAPSARPIDGRWSRSKPPAPPRFSRICARSSRPSGDRSPRRPLRPREKPPSFAAEPQDKSQRTVAARAGDIIAEHSDLALQLNARMELRAEKNQNERCAVSGIRRSRSSTARAASFRLTDFQFNARSGGVVADRIHVDVDYDTQREFDGSNNISVNYEGKGNELLQRLELGNVTFQPPVSRFITAGIPSGNYGLQAITQDRAGASPRHRRAAEGQHRQRSRLHRRRSHAVRPSTAASKTTSSSRAGSSSPSRRRLFGSAYPNIDILDSRRMEQLAMSLPDTLRPTRVFLYRLLIGGQPPNPSGPQFRILGDPRSRRGPVYERLREGIDYYVDPSQLWIALVRPLSLNNERLVVAYRVSVERPGHDPRHDRRNSRSRVQVRRRSSSRTCSGIRRSLRRIRRSSARSEASIASADPRCSGRASS